MISFKALDLDAREVFRRYLGDYQFMTCEYSFLTLYLWRKYYHVEYGSIKDALIVKKKEAKTGAYFMQPLGYSDETLPDIIAELIRIKQGDAAFKCVFRDIEEPFLRKLEKIYGRRLLFREDVDNFDYIYATRKLITLTGPKLRKRKNLYNQFLNSYNFSIKDIHDRGVVADCLDFSKWWFANRKEKNKEIFYELEGIRDVLTHLELLHACGMAVYVNNEIAGFTIGEKLNNRMAVIHVEKGDTQYKGIYAFINKTFVEKYFADVPYINREEDLGLAGLKKAKLAYEPLKLEKKYIVDFL